MAECSQSPVTFHEMHGIIEPRAGSALTTDALVLSNIERGTAFSPARTGLCIRYVARGREIPHRRPRVPLDAGHVMVATCDLGTEIDIRKSDSSGHSRPVRAAAGGQRRRAVAVRPAGAQRPVHRARYARWTDARARFAPRIARPSRRPNLSPGCGAACRRFPGPSLPRPPGSTPRSSRRATTWFAAPTSPRPISTTR